MIDPIFNMFKIRYHILDDFNGLNKTLKTRVFINLEMVMKVLLTKRVNEYAEGLDNVELQRILLSNIINLAQHYRLYLTKNRIANEVYLFWNYPTKVAYLNTEFLDTYRKLWNDKFTDEDNETLSDTLEEIHSQMKTIIKYVNEVYLVDGGMVDSAVIPYIIAKRKENGFTQNVIVSNNRYDFQYIKHGFVVWYPDKDKSIVLTKENIYKYLKEKLGIKGSKDNPSVNFLPFILSALGDRYRCIEKFPKIGLGTLLKAVNTGLKNNVVTSKVMSEELLEKLLPKEYHDMFYKAYRMTDVEYQYMRVSITQEAYILDQLQNRFDDDSLYYLNDKYFKDHLIMIIDNKQEQIMRNTL